MSLDVQQRRRQLEEKFPIWPRTTIATHFYRRSGEYGERPLIMTPDAVYSYSEVWRQARTLAKSLIALGVRRRDHVAALMANEPEYLFLMLAISMVGAVCVPINTMLRKDELRYILSQSDSRFLFIHQVAGSNTPGESVRELMDEVQGDELGRLEHIICIPNGQTPPDSRFLVWESVVAKADTISDSELNERWANSEYPDDMAMVIYTSGSTGLPKGVMLTHDMLLRCGFSSCLSRAFEDGRRVFTALPLYHVFALVEGLMTVSFVGGAVITAPSFVPTKSLQLMETFHAQDFLCVPSMLVALLNHPDVTKYDLSSLYAMMCAAAPAPVPVWQRAVEVFGLTEMCTGYGGTEATAATVHSEVGDPVELIASRVGRIKPGGSSGLPEFGGKNVQYKVIDPFTAEDLLQGSVGELTVRGNFVTRGYYKKPEETHYTIDKDGWLRTGDLGRIDENGYIELLGRSKDVYKVSGENVSPKEVEEVISRHPAVSQVYVVGVTDSMTTEAGAAFVELKPGQTCTRRDIIEWCEERIARYKIPRHVWFVEPDEWPMTGTGKIQKFRLQEIAKQKLS